MSGKLGKFGDMPSGDFRKFGYQIIDQLADYFDEMEKYPVLSQVEPDWLKNNLPTSLHVGQFADVGGAELSAELGAHSADHLENVGAKGVLALASAGVFAGLLPLASFTLGQAPPDGAALRAAGVRLVVASDANPGTAPTESLPLALAFAVRSYGLSPDEALLGATQNAAESLGLGASKGRIRVGYDADFAAFDLPHEIGVVQPFGVARTRLVVREGHALHGTLA